MLFNKKKRTYFDDFKCFEVLNCYYTCLHSKVDITYDRGHTIFSNIMDHTNNSTIIYKYI